VTVICPRIYQDGNIRVIQFLQYGLLDLETFLGGSVIGGAQFKSVVIFVRLDPVDSSKIAPAELL
jgi:hypothetical protein